jgi:cell division protein FtsB
MKKRIFKPMNLLLIFGVCYLGYILVSQQIIINRIQGQIDEANSENKKIEESNKYLNDQIKYAQSDEYKERIAREKIGLIKPGEIIYILHDENASNDDGK